MNLKQLCSAPEEDSKPAEEETKRKLEVGGNQT